MYTYIYIYIYIYIYVYIYIFIEPFFFNLPRCSPTVSVSKTTIKKKKIKNRSASLRYAGPILTFYRCTGANLSRYNSSVHGTFCGSWKLRF